MTPLPRPCFPARASLPQGAISESALEQLLEDCGEEGGGITDEADGGGIATATAGSVTDSTGQWVAEFDYVPVDDDEIALSAGDV